MGDGLASGDLERVRRSLAMSPSVPKSQAEALLVEVHRLRAVVQTLGAEIDAVMGALRSVQRQADDALP